jgi:hypothetical protein
MATFVSLVLFSLVAGPCLCEAKAFTEETITDIPASYILLVSFPAPGHYTSLLELGRKLQEVQNRTVVAVSFELEFETGWTSIQKYLDKYFPMIDTLAINNPVKEPTPLFNLPEALSIPSLVKLDVGLSKTNRGVYQTFMSLLPKNPPSLIIYEEFTTFGGVAAKRLGIPAVYISAHVEPGTLGFQTRPLTIPPTIGNTNPDLASRANNLAFRLAGPLLLFLHLPRSAALCLEHGLPILCYDADLLVTENHHLVIGTSAHPVVIPSPFSPNIQLVGPLIPPVAEHPEWGPIIDKIAETASGIIYITMGSDMNMTLAQASVVVEVLEEVTRKHNLHVIWAR